VYVLVHQLISAGRCGHLPRTESLRADVDICRAQNQSIFAGRRGRPPATNTGGAPAADGSSEGRRGRLRAQNSRAHELRNTPKTSLGVPQNLPLSVSFPRKRESRVVLHYYWTPACAGVTGGLIEALWFRQPCGPDVHLGFRAVHLRTQGGRGAHTRRICERPECAGDGFASGSGKKKIAKVVFLKLLVSPHV
jgi:hypothetical protein